MSIRILQSLLSARRLGHAFAREKAVIGDGFARNNPVFDRCSRDVSRSLPKPGGGRSKCLDAIRRPYLPPIGAAGCRGREDGANSGARIHFINLDADNLQIDNKQLSFVQCLCTRSTDGVRATSCVAAPTERR